MESTLILGIGNTLLKDEGAGVHVIEYLRKTATTLPHITLMDGGTLSFTLVADIEDYQNLIIIDAAELGKAPGSLRCLENEDLDDFLGKVKRSVHEVSLLDLMDMARLAGLLPRRRALIGIQPQTVDWGDQLSAPVYASIPWAAQMAVQLVETWTSNQGEVKAS